MDSYSYWETVDKGGDEKHYSSCYTPATDKPILIEQSDGKQVHMTQDSSSDRCYCDLIQCCQKHRSMGLDFLENSMYVSQDDGWFQVLPGTPESGKICFWISVPIKFITLSICRYVYWLFIYN